MKILFLLLLLCKFFVMPAYAEDVYYEAANKFGTSNLEDQLTGEEIMISGKIITDGSYDVNGAISRLMTHFFERLKNEFRTNIQFGLSLTALSVLCAFTASISTNKEITAFIEMIGCAGAAALMLGGMDSLVHQTTEAMYRLSDYSKAALPVVFSAAAAGGALSSAATKFAAVTFALDILMSISQKLIIPLIYYYLALSVADAMFSNPVILGMKKLCKWSSATLMSAITIAFTTYLGMIGAIGSAADAATVKAARTFISGVLPVVGGMISEASATLISAAGVVRNSAGVFSLICVCILCAGPFALLSVKMLVFKAVSAVSDSMSSPGLSGLFSSLATAMGILLGLLGSCGIMLFISIASGMKAVAI